jgi:hypothetical protein
LGFPRQSALAFEVKVSVGVEILFYALRKGDEMLRWGTIRGCCAEDMSYI